MGQALASPGGILQTFLHLKASTRPNSCGRCAVRALLLCLRRVFVE